jgi:hypothetical protein
MSYIPFRVRGSVSLVSCFATSWCCWSRVSLQPSETIRKANGGWVSVRTVGVSSLWRTVHRMPARPSAVRSVHVLEGPESTQSGHSTLRDERPLWIGFQPLDVAIFGPLGILSGIDQSEVQPSEILKGWSSQRSNQDQYQRCYP